MDTFHTRASWAGDISQPAVLTGPIVPTSVNTTKQYIKICTYNIMHGGGSRFTLALKALLHMNIDVAVLTETKLAEDTYTKGAYGYTVYATDNQHAKQGGVALIIKDSNKFTIKGVKKFGINVITAILVSGNKKWL